MRSSKAFRAVTPRKRQLLAESGFALPTAIIILFVVTLLTGTAITAATQSSKSATRDTNVKAELEAAEAGLQVASYRLTQLGPSETQCINKSEAITVAAKEVESKCKDGSESLGNGASFQYWTTLPLKAGETCAGRTVASIANTSQRCATSVGTANGVEPAVRLQLLVSGPSAGTLFPVNGLLGLESVEIGNNTEVDAKGGTNGKLSVGNNSNVESVALGKSSPPSQPEGGGTWGPVTREATDFALSPVSFGGTATENSNYRIENGLKVPQTSPYDESSGIEYKATRTLEVGNKGELKLGGGVYNFCNLTLGNKARIEVLGETKIYIDSPNDPSSKCKAGDGVFSIANNANIVNPSNDPTKLQIYVFDESGGPVEMSNNLTFYGTIYAPHSTVNIKNNAEWVGAVAAKSVSLKNNGTFRSDKRVESLVRPGPWNYHRSAWGQCTPGSGPSAAC
jgi:Tfp pilus assembly protein PilX